MNWFEALILGIMQGFAEFLPISSSGHLVLVPWWLGWDAPPLEYDVAVHLGTTLAVLIYFWRDWLRMLTAGWQALWARQFQSQADRLLVDLLLATLPGAIAGLLVEDIFESTLSRPILVSLMLLVTAAILAFSEYWSSRYTAPKTLAEITLPDALWIGVAQAVAILPGVSRSGSTMATGLIRQLSRAEAAHFSFLLATPIILGAGAKKTLDLLLGGLNLEAAATQTLIIGFLASAISGYLCIAFLLRLLRQYRFYGFAIYCAIFGSLSFVAILLRG